MKIFLPARQLILLGILFTILSACNMKNKIDSNEIYTLGIWQVKTGKETEFINEWTSFANWTSKNISGGKGYLLRDVGDPSRFISFGPWDSESTVQKWRESEEFKTFVAKVKELCDDFQPNTLKVASITE